MSKTAEKQAEGSAAAESDDGLLQQVTACVIAQPEWFDTVLEALAGVLIDIAEKDGTIEPIEGRTAGADAA